MGEVLRRVLPYGLFETIVGSALGVQGRRWMH
jgi:hypothetical protein